MEGSSCVGPTTFRPPRSKRFRRSDFGLFAGVASSPDAPKLLAAVQSRPASSTRTLRPRGAAVRLPGLEDRSAARYSNLSPWVPPYWRRDAHIDSQLRYYNAIFGSNADSVPPDLLKAVLQEDDGRHRLDRSFMPDWGNAVCVVEDYNDGNLSGSGSISSSSSSSSGHGDTLLIASPGGPCEDELVVRACRWDESGQLSTVGAPARLRDALPTRIRQITTMRGGSAGFGRPVPSSPSLLVARTARQVAIVAVGSFSEDCGAEEGGAELRDEEEEEEEEGAGGGGPAAVEAGDALQLLASQADDEEEYSYDDDFVPVQAGQAITWNHRVGAIF
eukprot:g5246.t1